MSAALELAHGLRLRLSQSAAGGRATPAAHELLRESGLDRMLLPESAGGLGLDLAGFLAVLAELAQGAPQAAWCTAALAAGSARAHELFASDGAALCALAVRGDATAQRTPTGWVLSGRFDRCAGAAAATHVLAFAAIEGEEGTLRVLAARDQFECGDDGEHACAVSVTFAAAAIADAQASVAPAALDDWEASVPAAAMAAVFAGASARAAELAEAAVRAAPATRALDPDHQRWLGAAIAHAAAAALLLEEAAASAGESLALAALARQAMRFAWEGAQEALRAGTSCSRAAHDELEAIARFMLAAQSDGALAPAEWVARQLARARLGLEPQAALPAA